MRKDKEKIREEKRTKEEYLKKIFDKFLIDVKETFNQFDLSNLNKNAEKIYFDVETKIQTPAAYIAETNSVILGQKLDDKYTEDERKHAIYHELVHMTTTKKARSFNPKTGFSFIAGAAIAKRVAITEGMTEYMTERITGNEIDIAYLFEKRCAKSLCMIFGDDVIQDFLNADEKSLYKRAHEYGIPKSEIKEVFNSIDKSLMWRNNSVVDFIDGKQIKKKNKYISDIEQKLVNMAVRVSLEKGESKEETAEKIDKISQNFIQSGLEVDINDKKEENFLSQYSEKLNEPFEYAKKIKEEILNGKIVSANELVTKKSSIKDKMISIIKIKRGNEKTALPSSNDKNMKEQETKESFIAELEGLKNSANIDMVNEKDSDKKEIEREEEKTI